MSVKQLPPSERPRQKLLRQGASILSDAELLAIFLGSGTPERDAIQLARDLLEQAGGLVALGGASEKQFCALKGLGQAKYALLQASLEFSRRYLHGRLNRGETLTNPRATQDYLKLQLYASSYEIFACIFLDNRHRIISYEELFRGTIDCASVYPREVLRKVMEHNAAAVIFAHNHPSGIAEPSTADKDITRRLKASLELIDVRVLDHIIIGEDACTSMAEHGLL